MQQESRFTCWLFSEWSSVFPICVHTGQLTEYHSHKLPLNAILVQIKIKIALTK